MTASRSLAAGRVVGAGLLALSLALLAAPKAQAAEFFVPTGNDLIQAAINGAVAGDTVRLAAGLHKESAPLVIPAGKNGLILTGNPGAVVQVATVGGSEDAETGANGAAPGLNVLSDKVAITYIRFQPNPGPNSNGLAVRLAGLNDAFSFNTVVNFRAAVYVASGGTGAILFRDILLGVDRTKNCERRAAGFADEGVELDAGNVVIKGGLIEGFGEEGIEINTNNNRVEGVKIDLNCGSGIRIDAGTGNTIVANLIVQNQVFGIVVSDNNNLITRNRVVSNRVGGIEVLGNKNRVTFNTLLNNGWFGTLFCGTGIFIGVGATDNVVTDNVGSKAAPNCDGLIVDLGTNTTLARNVVL